MSTSSPTDPEVVIFFTGGTICMRPETGKLGVVPGDGFERFFGELRNLLPQVRLRAVPWSDLPSPHMTPQLMFQLARDVDAHLAGEDVVGAVVIHGTDVLVESAFMAELTIRSSKPVVYTGAMRYLSEIGYDGIRNLVNAIRACILPLPPQTGTVLLMADRFFSAREVAKINSLNVAAFEAPDSGPIGYVAGESILLTRPPCDTPKPLAALPVSDRIETEVALISCYTGMDAELIAFLDKKGIRGLVVEGFGAGNVPPKLVPALRALSDKKIPVVLTTQCPEGGTWPIYAYPGGGADLQKIGIIPGGRLPGAKARILMMAVLGGTREPDEVRKWVHHYGYGPITPVFHP